MTSPLSGKLITIFGGGGFLGHYVAQALLNRGARLRIASRNPEKSFSLKALANLGQIQFVRCDITREASPHAALADTDAVVNCAAAWDNKIELMGNAPGRAARIARECGATAWVEMSSIGADPESPAEFGRAKALGEHSVQAAFPKATIVRPSVIFGKDDTFINMFAQAISLFPVLPVFGPESKLQLVYVDDVADAIARSLEDTATHGGKTYELGGPEALSMMEINQRIAAAQGRKRQFIALPDFASALFAALPGTPMSSDQWIMLKAGSQVSGKLPGFKQLGIEPRPLGLFLDRWMVRYRKHGRFGRADAIAG